MNSEFDVFKKSLENVNDLVPTLSNEGIEMYLSELNSSEEHGLKPSILVIDDDPDVRSALEISLKKKYNIILCKDGNEGIEKVNPTVVCVILDVKMNGKNGFETFVEIKKKFLYLPIIFHSAFQNVKNPYEIMNDLHPFGYIVKGGENRELLSTLEVAIGYYLQINKNSLLVQQLQKTNKDLTESKKKYKDLVENSMDIIFSIDSDGFIKSINKSVTNILKYNVKSLANKKLIDLIYKSNDANQVSVNENIYNENLYKLIESKTHIAFNCDMVTDFGEPQEMHFKLKYIATGDSFSIFGTASSIDDDILFRLCESENQTYEIGNYLTQVDIICKRVAMASSKYIDQDIAVDLRLCLKELLVNSVEHGNLGITFAEKTESLMNDEYFNLLIERQKIPENIKKKIRIEYSLNSERVEFRLTDSGKGFDHKKMLAKSKDDIDLFRLGHGRGIIMAREFFDTIQFNESGNSVYLVKNFTKQ